MRDCPKCRQSFEMEVDRVEDSFHVAHHSPPSVVTKVGIKLEDMGMGGNKRTVFYNKNKKLVEIQASLTKNGYCFTPSTRDDEYDKLIGLQCR